MTISPVVTIFVRHSADCKYHGEEFEKRCRCRKHLRWSQNGKQYRRKAGTRSWGEAENVKRELEAQLSGRVTETPAAPEQRLLPEATELFLKDKKVQGVSKGVLGKYTRELDRLRTHCERAGVYTAQGITRELLTEFAATWESVYPSSSTRSKVRERCRAFLRYCYECQWIPRIPALPKIQVDEPETMPLTDAEFKRLLDATYAEVSDTDQRARVHALFQLMRWSGLAIGDALRLERSRVIHDEGKGVHRVVTARQKTGTPVSVPIPPDVAEEVLKVLNGNPRYVFWSGKGEPESISKNWSKYYVRPCFEGAKIESNGNMMSHRLRDTFACDLLQKGVPLEEVSKLLGHESIKTTERSYAKWIQARQDRLDTLVMTTWAK
ncbi:phage integrase [Candidatus Koribacter versatilis Ellin345]|uniref:Phage integrase n=1 Tax=Koribacter versatilis (strain Ellin345) TaxID=204669 RepID=Q1IK38_KORVE|nr:tyrosine-type recombinase/integrase [Candidatus Koribacter versatilis]ABF42762.1 phage integrase [Candidatus Koribacter versatilis Ellin345]